MLLNMVLVEKAFAISGFMQLVTRSVGQADVPVLLALSEPAGPPGSEVAPHV
jgi:ABC-type dipeptide/oligopeptide/nickel transport system permease component